MILYKITICSHVYLYIQLTLQSLTDASIDSWLYVSNKLC